MEASPALVKAGLRERTAHSVGVTVGEGDMAEVSIPVRFGSVSAVRSTFVHLGAPARRIAGLETIASHLQNEGTLCWIALCRNSSCCRQVRTCR
ncbi:MAG TPA: hypothetical protein VNT03_07275 [Baekduia sp.]|nr:hypothetical protein [Baekduia sp.]